MDIIADNPFDGEIKCKNAVIAHLKSEVMRLKIAASEPITEANLLGDFGQPNSFNILRSKNWG